MERWQKPEAEPPPHRGTADHDDPSTRSSLDYTTPLRSIIRGDAAAAAPSPFFKLSSELSRESLRVPGAVPFLWEQSPGLRKFASSTLIMPSATAPSAVPQPQASLSASPERSSTATVPDAAAARPNLASLLRQPSLKSVPSTADSWPTATYASSADLPRIPPPPAADQTRSFSARFSLVMPHKALSRSSFRHASVHGNGDDHGVGTLQSDGEDFSETVTAMAGDGLSTMDDSLLLSGPLRPASTPSEARDFIMNRFLPAAHTIACESPQTPSRRFVLPAIVTGGPDSPATSGQSRYGSFRDRAATGAAACRSSPLRFASASSTPGSNYNAMQLRYMGQQCGGSFHGGWELEEDEDDEEDDAEEDASITSKACGIFPFHLDLSFHNWRRRSHTCFFPKHQHITKQQHRKKLPARSPNCTGSRTRIMDILHDDHSSIHGDETPVHPLRIKQLKAERERSKIAAFEQSRLLYPLISPRMPSESSKSSLYHDQQADNELHGEEASEYRSFEDAPSRFQSPSPAALQHNARAARGYGMQSPLAGGNAQRSLSFAGLQEGHPHSAVISTTEQHLLKSSFYYYNMNSSSGKPRCLQPSTYHTPPLVGASPRHSCAYHGSNSSVPYKPSAIKPEHQELSSYSELLWDTECHRSTQKTRVINNALYEHEDSEVNNATSPGMFSAMDAQVATYNSANGTRLRNHGTNARTEREHGGCRYGYGDGGPCMDKDAYHVCERKCDRCLNKEDHADMLNQCVSNGKHNGDHTQDHVSNGDLHRTDGSHQGDGNYRYYHAGTDDSPHAMNGLDLINKNAGVYASKSLLSPPPLPKSPTHSWLGRAMPLVASTNRSHGTSSRFSQMHKATASPADHDSLASMTNLRPKQLPAPSSAAEASKWEALVRGSHRQPGHLRFSEELFNQTQSITKVAAS